MTGGCDVAHAGASDLQLRSKLKILVVGTGRDGTRSVDFLHKKRLGRCLSASPSAHYHLQRLFSVAR
jgi:hypothetical protein